MPTASDVPAHARLNETSAPAFVGTAGWSIPRASAPHFPGIGTHLQRYARTLRCAEINSSFYRPHAVATYARWAASTPPGFLFAVKVPRTITHESKLQRARAALEQFLRESAGLGDKRGPLLVQLPPSLQFERRVAGRFFDLLRERHQGSVVCEPRHASWFTTAVSDLLGRYGIARVAADPPVVPAPTVLAVFPASSITAFTGRRGNTGHRMAKSSSTGWRTRLRHEAGRRGVCSTTRPVVRRSRTPTTSTTAWMVVDGAPGDGKLGAKSGR